ncbi:polyisoprenoid-binding protein YceI [Luteococcus japonicus]|uniref:Polyisoprenoid-binding protein YceI n=1 Tax=Luteococcus japonicus TaxID=33984 RepID=A0A3N1ZU32_9ACTN|nr:YceI family protein [Luteococcus japonicus]ROR54375.1 polyisoprenoid-binding protein YceI [Luteococcus japonicus]
MQGIRDIHGLYHLDPAHSALGFRVRHAGLSRIRGTFDQFHGHALIDGGNVQHSALMVSISASSINTLVTDRDAHLRSADFLDVATYPALTFVGTDFEILDDDHVRVGGDLTIKDVTRRVDMVFAWGGSSTDPFGNERIGFQSELAISRAGFGLTWNAALETGGWLIGDEVTLEIEASAVKKGSALPDEEPPGRRTQDAEAAADPADEGRPARRSLEPEASTGSAGEGGTVSASQPAAPEVQTTNSEPQTTTPGSVEETRIGFLRRLVRRG